MLLLELLITSLALTEDASPVQETSVKSLSVLHESSCCSSSSLPFLPKDDYKDQGSVVLLDDLPVYIVGDNSTTKAIVWNYDIFGFDAGRTRQLCDLLAAAGYLVALPDYFRGTRQEPGQPFDKEFAVRASNWTNLEADWVHQLRPYLEKRGVATFGTIGTCWGTYVTVKLSTLPEFSAGVSMHPSHSPIMALLGENEEDTLKGIKPPQLMMPSRTDSPNVKTDGLAQRVLGDRVRILEFPEMDHGWTVRGNLSLPAVERDVHKAVAAAIAFFESHL